MRIFLEETWVSPIADVNYVDLNNKITEVENNLKLFKDEIGKCQANEVEMTEACYTNLLRDINLLKVKSEYAYKLVKVEIEQ